MFFIFTWLPFQIVFLSAHQCKETNYGQTESIEHEKIKQILKNKKNKKLPCNIEQKGIDIAKKHQCMPEKMQRFAQNHQMNEITVKSLSKINVKEMQSRDKSQ